MSEEACPICGVALDEFAAEPHHVLSAHTGCRFCGAAFESERAVYVHWLVHHENDLSPAARERAEAAVGPVTLGNRLVHEGPRDVLDSLALSRRRALTLGAVGLGLGGVGAVAGKALLDSGDGSATATGELAPRTTFSTLDGETEQLSAVAGEPVMLWLFATWCSTCKRGAEALADHGDRLGDLQILALKTAGNAGYSGPSIREFIYDAAPAMRDAPNWTWGTASETTTSTYNPSAVPDVYYLIDREGRIQVHETAPATTIEDIVSFAEAEGVDGA